MADLEGQNRELRETVNALKRKLSEAQGGRGDAPSERPVGGSATTGYTIDEISGKFRLMHGWQCLGYHDTPDDARVQAAIHFALAQVRVRFDPGASDGPSGASDAVDTQEQ